MSKMETKIHAAKTGHVMPTFRFPRTLHSKLKKEAGRNARTLNGEVTFRLMQSLAPAKRRAQLELAD